MRALRLGPRLARFRRNERGAVLVEFLIALPVMILFFVIIIEFGRLYWGYQSVVPGVRDSSRYLARVAPVDICLGTGSLSAYEPALKKMIEQDAGGGSVLPAQVTVDSVTASHTCVAGSYRTSPAPVASVSAQVTMQFPLGHLFSFFGAALTSMTTTVTDSTRIFGQ